MPENDSTPKPKETQSTQEQLTNTIFAVGQTITDEAVKQHSSPAITIRKDSDDMAYTIATLLVTHRIPITDTQTTYPELHALLSKTYEEGEPQKGDRPDLSNHQITEIRYIHSPAHNRTALQICLQEEQTEEGIPPMVISIQGNTWIGTTYEVLQGQGEVRHDENSPSQKEHILKAAQEVQRMVTEQLGNGSAKYTSLSKNLR